MLRKTCSKSCLCKLNWKGNKHSESSKKKMRKSPIYDILDVLEKEYESNKTFAEIADSYKLNKNTLRIIFKRNGFKKIRNTGARKGRTPWNYGKEYLRIRGKNHPNWKGGITKLNNKVRHCIEYYNWMRAIMKRDNWTCSNCQRKSNGKNVIIEVDHYPKKFSEIMKENKITSYEEAQKCNELWDINNGRVLCLDCHNRTKMKLVRSRFKKVSGVTTRNQDSLGQGVLPKIRS